MPSLGQPTSSSVNRPTTTSALALPSAPSVPTAQAGSPLYHILATASPETGVHLRNLFALLQSKAVTLNEFWARAEELLGPEQFEILDGIRRKHGLLSSDGTPTQQQSSNVSAVAPGVSLPTATPASTPSFPATSSISHSQSASIAASLPSTSSSTPQSAPVRKRNTDTTAMATTPTESKVASKRVKTEHLPLVSDGVGTAAGGSSTQPGTPTALPTFPRTPGTSTPVGAASPGVFSQVSLPGQQRATATAGGAGLSGTAGKSSTTGVEKVNFENITDVMGYVGVDLKEESDNIMRDNDGYSKSSGGDGQDRTRVQNFVNIDRMKAIVERI
ncbi:hypothetical protein BGX27_004561, partial [Mortierella sp. AM989]